MRLSGSNGSRTESPAQVRGAPASDLGQRGDCEKKGWRQLGSHPSVFNFFPTKMLAIS